MEMTLNLARKELRLQKPMLLVAGLFCLGWFCIFALHLLQPRQVYTDFLSIILALYLPICMVLAGCISLGEERTLGLTGWSLTFPVSVMRQWLVKIGLGWLVAVLVGGLLPWILVRIWSLATPNQVMEFSKDGWWQAVLVSGLLFVFSFWASTLFGDTVRSALAALVALAGTVACAFFGNWCARQLGGLESGVLEVMALPLYLVRDATGGHDLTPACLFLGTMAFTLLILAESLYLFRRPHPQPATVLKACLSVLIAGVVVSFWITDLAISASPIFAAPS